MIEALDPIFQNPNVFDTLKIRCLDHNTRFLFLPHNQQLFEFVLTQSLDVILQWSACVSQQLLFDGVGDCIHDVTILCLLDLLFDLGLFGRFLEHLLQDRVQGLLRLGRFPVQGN